MEAQGPIFSVLNGVSPAPSGPTAIEAIGPIFSLFNGASPSSLTSTTGSSVPIQDSDGDGLSDEEELARTTNPVGLDTDEDGFPDGLEVALGSNPLDGKSAPNLQPPGYYDGPMFSVFNSVVWVRDAPVRNFQVKGDAYAVKVVPRNK
jgi:hypothetical protein